MSDNIYLMHKNTKVMEINLDENIFQVLDSKYIPFELKGIVDNLDKNINNKRDSFITFLSERVLPLSRTNAKKIYNAFSIEQSNSPIYRAQIAITYKAVSLQDNFWIKNINDETSWDDINLRTNSLSEAVAQIALHGKSLTIQGKVHTPEINGQGSYAKAWKRENGDLYLYKRSAPDGKESEIEVKVSNILDKCNVPHIEYLDAKSGNDYCCKCKCMTTDDISILPASFFMSYCTANGLNPDLELKKIDADNYYKMCIVDYLVSNSDRHGFNWGFFYNSNTMEILGLHPLFDHNNCFDEEIMKNPNMLYQAGNGKTFKEAAKFAKKHTDFHFIKEITKDDFLTKEQYLSFTKRAKELNIQISPTMEESLEYAQKQAEKYNKMNLFQKFVYKMKER